MSSGAGSQGEALTRDQLLTALDKEIIDTNALQASSGRTKWNLLLSIAALIGVGIQYWETSAFSVDRVVALALGLSATWDLIKTLLSGIDASPATSRRYTKFFFASDLFGAHRSTLLVMLARHGLIILGAFWISSPYIGIFRGFAIYEAVKVALLFLASYFRIATPVDAPEEARGLRRFLNGFGTIEFLLQGVATFIIAALLWTLKHQIKVADVRLAIIVTAATYLVLWLGEESIYDVRIQQMRNIRHNLSFAHISLEEARRQVDFLLAGVGVVHALRQPFEELAYVLEKARKAARDAEALVLEYNKLAPDMSAPYGQTALDSPLFGQLRRTHLLCRDSYLTLKKNLKSLQKQIIKFRTRCALLTIFSPASANDAKALLEKVSTEVAPFEKQMKALKESLDQQESFLSTNMPPTDLSETRLFSP